MTSATDTITFLWPPGAHPAVVVGRWEWMDQRILADYTMEELFWAVACTCSEETLEKLMEETR